VLCHEVLRSVQEKQVFIQESIPDADSHTHLGIELNGKLSALSRTTNACRKGRNTYLAISNIRDDNASPLIVA
jgi:hypothetical protein